MAFFRGVIRSDTLGMDTGLNVILPYDRQPDDFAPPCRVLYLLHGLGDNCDAWTRYTGIERYARDKGLAVIMPEVQRSFYLDMTYGLKYFSYVTEELPGLCMQMFHIGTRREDTVIAGLSMGGYGAMKCGLSRPDLYGGAASFSGALDIHEVVDSLAEEDLKPQLQAAIGMELSVRDSDDLKKLAELVAAMPRESQPGLFITCGQQDFLYNANIGFKNHLEDLTLPFQFEEWPGEHEWGFWDVSVRQALEFFFH